MDEFCREKISMKNPVHFLALGFGSGLSPFMPGTAGTIAAIPLVLLIASFNSLPVFLTAVAVSCIVGVYLCGKTADDMEVHDHSAIVWDEVAGLLITMIAVPISWQTVLVGFLVFRFFDIVKPWPLSYFDKHVHGGFGIMIDDIIAGLFSLAVMHGLLFQGWL